MSFLENLDIVFAVGPFTLQSDLSYEPLLELLKYVVETKPNILILMGPFLEETHDFIRNDECEMDEFGLHFDKIIETIVDSVKSVPNIQIVVISSSKDVQHYPVYPTPAYTTSTKYPNVKFMPDPCMLNISGIIIGLTSVDVLFHLGKCEYRYFFFIFMFEIR